MRDDSCAEMNKGQNVATKNDMRWRKEMEKSGLLSKVAYWIIGLSLLFVGIGFEDALIAFHKPVDIYAEDFWVSRGLWRWSQTWILL